MAITAWSANVENSSICLSVNGLTSDRVSAKTPIGMPSHIRSAAGGPFELRYVHLGQDDLVAVWYRAFNPRPSAMPLLTLSRRSTSPHFCPRTHPRRVSARGSVTSLPGPRSR